MPVRESVVERHVMHEEQYSISLSTADMINSARRNGGRVFAVGTTSARAIESASSIDGEVQACVGETGIFIYPGYKFKVVGALVTNFHLPKSTLLMLVCSLAGRENVLAAYAGAIREKYRFYSYGDAMLVI
jgi:S-adenosylmethionine:tRNA ribosyltransferase-isomerase